MPPSESPALRALLGAAILYAGIALCALVVLDNALGLPFSFPGSWYTSRALWGLTGLCLAACGWKLQRSRDHLAGGWTPGAKGRRFRRLVVYSRADCHLCDDAKAILATYLDYLPDMEVVDVDTRPALQAQFGERVPVIELDGVVRFQGAVDELLLRRLLEGTPPLSSDPESSPATSSG